MSTPTHLTQPADAASAAKMQAAGLRMALVDADDQDAMAGFVRSATRGFHGGHPTPERLAESIEVDKTRRNVGVFDDANTDKFEPVGTVNGWSSRLAVPGEQTIVGWCISSVTVASTHSGRGIARALMEGELNTAVELGIPMAMLTVSESSLYGRYGFAPAVMASDLEIDVRRVTWQGPTPDGRIEYITNERFAELLMELHERLLPKSPGMVDLWQLRANQIAGTAIDEDGNAKKLRALVYFDAAGEIRGIANYKISGGDDDFTTHRLAVEMLVHETPDAYAALWRYLLNVPLVEKVTAHLRMVEEPLLWMITDWRAVTVKTWEHEYLRILNVTACLEARHYNGPGELVLDVDDPLGHASGRWLLTVNQDGVGRVTEAAADSRAPVLTLGVAELSAMYLGGVRAATLASAGRISGGAVVADGVFASSAPAYISIWY